MNIAELVESDGWKNFMGKLYGWGAAVVIIGALFKIMHWPGAGPMLIVGLGTEAIIFFFSAFEPRHEEPDWSLVYPQLAGLDEDQEAVIESVSGTGGSGVSKIDQLLLENIENGEELFKKLGSGLQNLSNTANALSDISNATLATNDYAKSMKTATTTADKLTDTYTKAADNISTAADLLSNSYGDSAEKVKASSSNLAVSYQKLADSMNQDMTRVVQDNKTYAEKVETLNKNLSALNAVYELQLQNSNSKLQASDEILSGIDQMMDNLKKAAKDSDLYQQELAKLSEKIVALNAVYGTMLGAMNNFTFKG